MAQGEPDGARRILSILLRNKRWWLAPLLVAAAVLGLLYLLKTPGLLPFAYEPF